MTSVFVDRQVNARAEFVSNLKEQFGYSDEQAAKILDVYRKAKAVKMDFAQGRYHLTHGAFWDKEVLDRALNLPA